MPREIEMWFTRVDGRYYGIAETGARAHWVRNIQAEAGSTLRPIAAKFRTPDIGI